MDDIEKAARLHNLAVKSPVYSYYFDYRGAHSMSELMSGSSDNIGKKKWIFKVLELCYRFVGVSHADDTSYVLKTDIGTLSTPKDREMSNLFVDIVTSYMETG